MPATFVGIVLFIVFLTPGLALLIVQEARRPKRAFSALRETAVLLLGGVIFSLLALGLFGIVHELAPSVTPNVGRLVRERDYLKKEYDAVLFWTLGLVTLATIAAAVVGTMDRVPIKPLQQLTERLRHITYQSAWYKAFVEELAEARKENPGNQVYCGCTLDDGSWVGGYLFSFNADVQEIQDRELLLVAPLSVRSPTAAEERVISNSGLMVVSARRIQYIVVSYVPAV